MLIGFSCTSATCCPYSYEYSNLSSGAENSSRGSAKIAVASHSKTGRGLGFDFDLVTRDVHTSISVAQGAGSLEYDVKTKSNDDIGSMMIVSGRTAKSSGTISGSLIFFLPSAAFSRALIFASRI